MKTTYVYVLGSTSGVGKSSVCQGILAQLLALGILPEQLGYIKPMTQCIVQQPVARFCASEGIDCNDLQGLIFKTGFTKDFWDGKVQDSKSILNDSLAAINWLAVDKKIVVIDGVGHPAVGSVIGVSNVDIAKALSSQVIFVGNPGFGAAVDETVLCTSYINSKGIKNIGLIFNKVKQDNLQSLEHYLSLYFSTHHPKLTMFGLLPLQPVENANLFELQLEQWAMWFGKAVDPNLMLVWLGLKKPRKI